MIEQYEDITKAYKAHMKSFEEIIKVFESPNVQEVLTPQQNETVQKAFAEGLMFFLSIIFSSLGTKNTL